MMQPDADANHLLHGGKRSRKSACPKRILQNQQQLTEAKASAICSAPDVSYLREDGEKRQRRELSPYTLAPPPTQSNFPIQLPSLPPPLLPTKEDSSGAGRLRSLADISSQSLIPTLYAALGGGGGGGFFSFGGAELGMMDGNTNTNGSANSLEDTRFRGRPKSTPMAANGPTRQQHQLQQKYQNQQQHYQQKQHQQQQQQKPQQRRGPRPFDPHSTPEPVRIITRKGVAYNRRPRSFYSPDIKLAVIEFAEQHGASAAERHFNVPLSTVQSWMRHDNKVRIMRASPQQMPPLTTAQFTQPQLPPPPPLPSTPLPLNLTFTLPSSRR